MKTWTIYPIVKIGDPTLTRRCENHFLGSNVIENMIETAKYHRALGLAANQVGFDARVFLFKRSFNINEYEVAIQPKITHTFAIEEDGEEGCLSVPNVIGIVPRHKTIDVEYTNFNLNKVQAQLTGMPARIFQHELDHLNGIFFLEKAKQLYYRK